MTTTMPPSITLPTAHALVQEYIAASKAYADALATEQHLILLEPGFKLDAVKRIMQQRDPRDESAEPGNGKTCAATTAEKFVEIDLEYRAHRLAMTRSVVARIQAEAERHAARALLQLAFITLMTHNEEL